MRNTVFIVLVLIGLNGCYIGPATYEVFESNMNSAIGTSWVTSANKKGKRVYSEDMYVYVYERPKNCIHGFLTNRDDKPEKVIGWIILSGKEYCKEQQAYGF